jgi:hypothetical protein
MKMRRAICASLMGLVLLVGAWGTPVSAQDEALSPGSIAQVVGRPGGRANVRSSPAIADGNVVGALPVGSAVTVQEVGSGEADQWVHVVAGSGMAGWVHHSLLALNRDATATALEEQKQPANMPEPPPQAEPAPAPAATADAPAATVSPPTAAPAGEPALTYDWTPLVPELMPAITSCADIPSIKPILVTRAYKLEQNLAGVRMEDPAGRRWECLILRRGGYPIRYEPIARGQRPMPGDGNPLFILAPGDPLNDKCHKSDELKDPATGMLLGWRVQLLCDSSAG